MVIVMEVGAPEASVQEVIARLHAHGFDVHRSSGESQVVLGAIGVQPGFDTRHLAVLDGVAGVHRVTEPYKLASRGAHRDDTLVQAAGRVVGGRAVTVLAGPLGVAHEAQAEAVAAALAGTGAAFVRTGAPSGVLLARGQALPPPERQAAWLRAAADRHGLGVAVTVTEAAHVDDVAAQADLLLADAPDLRRTAFLDALAGCGRPVVLQRGAATTIEAWLMTAEALLAAGNADVILCERGIRTFEPYTQRTLDLSAVAVVKRRSHLPVLVDPSHATGLRGKVTAMARAAVAAGADGLVVDVHPTPDAALHGGPQALGPEAFRALMQQIGRVAEAVDRAAPATA